MLLNPGLSVPTALVHHLHQWILQPSLNGSIFASGLTTLSTDQMDKLIQLLKDHGVPESKVKDRANQVGAAAIMGACVDKNCWAHLKAQANKPGIAFRSVLPDEFARHAEQAATTKYGAGISSHKNKKKADKVATSLPKIDPTATPCCALRFRSPTLQTRATTK